MKRRNFLQASATAAAAFQISQPALAQSMPEIKWRLTSSYPKSLDTLFGGVETFTRKVSEMTDGKFQIQVFAAGEIVPGLEAADAVSAATVEMCHTPSYYYWGKDPVFSLATGIPFGLNARMQNAWLYEGGGTDLMNGFFATHNLIAFPAGNTGMQMGGWFRKEINSTADLNGLKMRIPGLSGKIISKIGVVPQQIAGAEVYAAMERNALDAAEWSGPYDDEKIGFHKVAKYYYYPGWWECGPTVHIMVNLAKWQSLPPAYQAIIKTASAFVNTQTLARYDALNPLALKRLVSAGVQLKAFPDDVMDAAFKAAHQTYDEISSSNPTFKKIFDNMLDFRAQEYLWFQLAEYKYDSFMMMQQRKKAL